MDDHDLLVIGGGTAGLVAAAGGASMGARVALVERDLLGGECLHTGCVPSKALVRSAKVADLLRRSAEFGIRSGDVEVDFSTVMERMRSVVQTVGRHDDPQRFRDLGIDLRLGETARFVAPGRVEVAGRAIGARQIIVATGSTPSVPRIAGVSEAGFLTHIDALRLTRLPDSIVVVGAGPVGCELAQVFARFGARVTLLGSGNLPLPREDPEVGEALLEFLRADGIDVRVGVRAQQVMTETTEKVVSGVAADGNTVEARGEEVLIATGREPGVGNLDVAAGGIAMVSSGVMVDGHLRTSADNVWAAGDVTGKRLFTHTADYQAKIALGNALFPVRRTADYRTVPWTTFTDPEVARVGLTEQQARDQHDSVSVYRYGMDDLDRALTDGEAHGFVKLVTGRRGRILGAHVIGPDAGNLIAEIVLAMQRNLPVTSLSSTIRVYPTLTEGVKRAADLYYREKLFDGPVRKVLDAYFAVRRRLPP